MAGQLVPLVMVPRFTTFAGRSNYTTMPIDVSDYSQAVLTCWRGPGRFGDGALTIAYQESSDKETWATCSGTNPDTAPSENGQIVAIADLKRRWFRMLLVLSSSAPFQNTLCVTCWSVGHLVRREP